MALTMISKFFGFGREMVVASLFGASAETDAWFLAVGVPLLLAGPVTAAIERVFIPIFDDSIANNKAKSLLFRFSSLTLLITFAVLIVPVWIFAPTVLKIMAPGFDAQGIALAAGMVRVAVFLTFFRVTASIIRSVLHVNRNFIIPGLAGIPNNIIIMLFSFLFYRQWGIYALVWATLIASVFQLLYQLPCVLKSNLSGQLTAPSNNYLREMLTLLPPVILGSMSGQVKGIVDRMFASGLAEGSISFLNYASLLKAMPSTLLIGTVATVVYPSLVTLNNSKNIAAFKRTLTQSLSTMVFLTIPIMVGMVILAEPMVAFVYQRGAFDAAAAQGTSYAFRFFALGLPGYAFFMLMNQAFYAIKDTKTPLVAMLISVLLNAFLNGLLIGSLQHGGLALATSISLTASGLYLLIKLQKRIGHLGLMGLRNEAAKAITAGLGMALVCSFALTVAQRFFNPDTFVMKGLYVSILITLGALTYFALSWLLGSQGIKQSADIVKRLTGRRVPPKAA